MAECDRCDIYFEFDASEVYATGDADELAARGRRFVARVIASLRSIAPPEDDRP